MIKVGINGFGRIGRLAFRTMLKRDGIQVVAINDLLSIEQLAYLLKYDSVHGRFEGTVEVEGNTLIVNDQPIRVSFENKPEYIAWDAVDVDYVLESTGFFTQMEKAALHLKAGAKKVAISAPSEKAPMFVMGINHLSMTKYDTIFSGASCTTNCLAPVVKVLHDNFGLREGLMTTVHAATLSQGVVDGPQDKWRRGRAALNNIIPTSTYAADALNKVMPALKGKMLAMAIRVPTADVSLIDLTVRLEKPTTYEAIKNAMKNASENQLKGILGYTEDAVVSQDFVSEPRTAVFDADAGLALNDRFYKIIAWYDNEFGYATKIVDLIIHSAGLEN